jgi:hypothetical protein
MMISDEDRPPDERPAKPGAKVVPIGPWVGSRRPPCPAPPADEPEPDDPDPGPTAA